MKTVTRMEALALVFYYRKANRYSLNALGGALEGDPSFACLETAWARRPDDMVAEVGRRARSGRRVVAALSFFSTQAAEAAALAARLREAAGGRLFLLAGGPHPSGDPAGTLGMGFDAAAVGEGEDTLREVLAALAGGRPLAGVRGLALPGAGGQAVLSGRRRRRELGAHPPWSVRHRKLGPLEITRGCPHGCAFCQTTFIHGARPRHRSLEDILHWVGVLKGRGITDIRFISPDVFAWGSEDGRPDAARLEALLEGTRREAGPEGRVYFGSFPSEARPESVTREVLEVVRRHAVNDNIVIGAQTGSPRLLSLCRRGHGLDEVRRAVELIVTHGFKPYVDFIFGLPGETGQEASQTVAFMRELTGMGALIHAHAFMPLPGTPLAASPRGRLDPALRRAVRALIAEGKLFGEWHRQAAPGNCD